MAEKFKNKYRIESNRLSGWDYAGIGTYFITVVTNGRINWFGEIENGKMILSDFGKIVIDEWIKSFEIRNELFLDEYIIMPNHLHAIVILNIVDENGVETHGQKYGVEKHGQKYGVEKHGRVSLHHIQSNNPGRVFPHVKFKNTKPVFRRKPKSISSFVAGFKSATTNRIDDFIDANHLNVTKFTKNNRLWQPNYYDHIIRNKSEYYSIKNYIINNPIKWDDDTYKKEN